MPVLFINQVYELIQLGGVLYFVLDPGEDLAQYAFLVAGPSKNPFKEWTAFKNAICHVELASVSRIITSTAPMQLWANTNKKVYLVLLFYVSAIQTLLYTI